MSLAVNQPLKVALVHDYLREFGGAERVLEALHQLYPEAPVYTAFFDRKALGVHAERFVDWDVRETWLAKLPLFKKLYSPLRFLAPWAFASLDLSAYDLVISSSNAYFAKAVKVKNGKHICYCHTPPRVLYGYSAMSDWQSNPLMKFAGQLLNHFMRIVDVKISRERVDLFIANSQETASRIKKFYRLNAEIVYPPVFLTVQQPVQTKKGDYFLYVNRLALAKHPELAVQACTELKLPLKVVGTGKMLDKLQQIAGDNVEFLGAVSDETLTKLYQEAKALLYPVEYEDFGMVPVEAMLYGTPVIAHDSGGPRETVVNGKTGIVFTDLTISGLKAAVKDFNNSQFSSSKIKEWAKNFGKEQFNRGIKQAVDSILAK